MANSAFNIKVVPHETLVSLNPAYPRVAGNSPPDSRVRTGSSPSEVLPSASPEAMCCTTGLLIINGCKLHSHLCFHLLPADVVDPSADAQFKHNVIEILIILIN